MVFYGRQSKRGAPREAREVRRETGERCAERRERGASREAREVRRERREGAPRERHTHTFLSLSNAHTNRQTHAIDKRMPFRFEKGRKKEVDK